MNFLFICSKNQWRSPTAERIFGSHIGIHTRSAGTSRNARHSVNHADIEWADLIFVMEHKHKKHLAQYFGNLLSTKTVIVLDISDDYGYMDDELIEILTLSVSPYLPSLEPTT
ncbi:Low molecular weight protein-tyrosine-phosphatase ywlE [Moraxella lacunata]|uniref:Low molecular weight protein-tyrosine-phosphatase ywlE n=1 Tax=Moraxella lacunata TaxID=477 RepID=A0A378T791_MORLA|nr:protein tyrosine phosphatase [Moraxella lacunata]STZ56264.1 Low molecular weight protein-tyrosine-phosphatase ywlE [Moraxella lacunata]